jgi:Glycosyl transferases group 1
MSIETRLSAAAERKTGDGSSEPRILLPSARAFKRRAFLCGLYEAQDVLVDVDDVELLHFEPRERAGFRLRERWQHRLMYHDRSKRLVFANPGLKPIRLTRDYDLLVAVCQNYWDLLYLNAIKGWKDRCRTSVCWLDELWVADIPSAKYWLHALEQFDHVFLGYEGSVEAVSRAIGKRCHWIGGGVDAIRFSPYPRPPARVVDIYRIGRAPAGMDNALLEEAARNGLFYLHDTVHGSDLEPFDHRRHRELLGNVAKRSRYFIVAPAKVDMAGERAGQIEIGYRYYEGAAAGTVLIGQAPDCSSFRERFDWPDAVVEVKPDGTDVTDVLSALEAQPERLHEISRRNAAEALLRHDWLHRWKQIFQVAGITPSARMTARESRLDALARLAMSRVDLAAASQ